MRNFLKRTFISLLFLSALVVMNGGNTFALTDAQREISDRSQGVLFYDINTVDGQCGVVPTSSLGTPASPGLVYVIGDSIAVGADPYIRERISGGEWSVQIDALEGRSLADNSPNNFLPTSGQRANFSRASAIVYILGTNNYAESESAFANKINATIEATRSLNSQANIYWVDSAAKADDLASGISEINSAIYAQAPSNYQVVPWFNRVYGEEYNPRQVSSDLPDINEYMQSDLVHNTAAGQEALGSLIGDVVVGAAGQNIVRDDAVISGTDNVEYAYNYLIGRKGLTPAQAAGVVGNLIHESGVDPIRAEGSGYQTFSSMDEVRSGRGYGIAQWTTQGRQDAWRNFAAERGEDPLSLDLQLEFLWFELEQDPGYYQFEALTSAQTVREAAWIFLAYFERPAKVIDDPQFGGRGNYSSNVTTTPPTSGPASEVLDERTAAAEEVIQNYGEGSFLISCAEGIQGLGGINEPDYSANPDVQLDGSPPGAHKDSNCSGGFTVGAEALRNYVTNRWSPPVTSIGGYVCRAILFDNSRPTSIHGLGRALDIMVDGTTPDGLATGNEIRNFMINNATQLGVQRVIWDRHIWSSNQDGWRPFVDADSSPHTDHLHVEINIEASEDPNLI